MQKRNSPPYQGETETSILIGSHGAAARAGNYFIVVVCKNRRGSLPRLPQSHANSYRRETLLDFTNNSLRDTAISRHQLHNDVLRMQDVVFLCKNAILRLTKAKRKQAYLLAVTGPPPEPAIILSLSCAKIGEEACRGSRNHTRTVTVEKRCSILQTTHCGIRQYPVISSITTFCVCRTSFFCLACDFGIANYAANGVVV